MLALALSLAVFLVYLVYERVQVDRWRRRIPQTIIVTGTRGKSSVTRLLTSVLRAHGQKVLAKTTGSAPQFLWPDGSESEIKRRGAASILEQKTLLKHAAALNVDCVIAEVMSIHPENHFVETQQILNPDMVVITNSWPDHVDAQGRSDEEVAATLCLDIPDRATVVMPTSTYSSLFQSSLRIPAERLVLVKEDSSRLIRNRVRGSETVEFSENVDLACGLARHLGVEDDTIADGLGKMSRDSGALSIRTLTAGNPDKRLILVNAFAANDPTSTFRALVKASEVLPEASDVVGLMCLRSDRADRTALWLETLASRTPAPFNRLYVTGGHAASVSRRLDSAIMLKDNSVESIMETIAGDVADDTVVFGFGNFVGLGGRLAEYWNSAGVSYGT
jgi:poly-gamma-glutamate synthase PgsB/CapB